MTPESKSLLVAHSIRLEPDNIYRIAGIYRNEPRLELQGGGGGGGGGGGKRNSLWLLTSRGLQLSSQFIGGSLLDRPKHARDDETV